MSAQIKRNEPLEEDFQRHIPVQYEKSENVSEVNECAIYKALPDRHMVLLTVL